MPENATTERFTSFEEFFSTFHFSVFRKQQFKGKTTPFRLFTVQTSLAIIDLVRTSQLLKHLAKKAY